MSHLHGASNGSNGGGRKHVPTAGVEESIDRMIGLPPAQAPPRGGDNDDERAEFIPSSSWTGKRPGYYFGTSAERGTGYHLDVNAPGTVKRRKRSRDEAADDGGGEGNKRSVRFGQNETLTIPSRDSADAASKRPLRKTGEELLAEAEASYESSIAESGGSAPRLLLNLDRREIKSSALSLERAINKNQMARAEHPDDPAQFMDAELALNDEIVALKAAAADASASYGHLVELGTVRSLLTLLSHENSDVAMSVLSVLVELLDPALVTTLSVEGGGADETARRAVGRLANEVLDHAGLESICSNLGRLDESVDEDATGVDDALSLVESLLDLDGLGVLSDARRAYVREEAGDDDDDERDDGTPRHQSVASTVLAGTTFLSWLLERVNRKGGSFRGDIRLHASEVLASLLQHEDARVHASDLKALQPYVSAFDNDGGGPDSIPGAKQKAEQFVDGIELILQTIAAYRKKDPDAEEECECLENTFDALAASLLVPSNVETFLKAQGIELMLRCVREKVHAGGGSLRILNFALSGTSDDGSSYKRACERFVDAGGLKLLFPLFMGRGSSIPQPARCSDAGCDLARTKKALNPTPNNGAKGLSKRAKRALQARREWLHGVESNAIQVLYALTRNLDESSPYDAKARLLVKFVEGDCEKCDRLVELCMKYDEKMRLSEYRYYRSDEAEEAEAEGIDVDLAALNAKLKGGGDLFHRVGAVIAFASVGSKRCHQHILEQLKVKKSGIGVVKAALEEFSSLLDNGDQQSQLRQYLSAM